ncbi:MAG: hypothetical protein KJ626_06755 [Verrucomicrobia bacterium]|nr:hypothetical protein [Verrucomicrobiota bacterium]
MSESAGSLVERYGLRSYEVDKLRRVRPTTICRFFQETAWHHAEALGYGYEAMAAKGIFWAMARMCVRMTRYPQWQEDLTVETWPSARDRMFCYRDFRVRDAAAIEVGVGTTTWLALDLESRKPWKTDAYMKLDVEGAARALDRNAAKVPVLMDSDMTDIRPVRYSDIDVNGHVNNVIYIDRLLDCFADDFLETNTLCELDINFVGEAVEGDDIEAHLQSISPSLYLHALRRRQDGSDLCRATTSWMGIRR